MTGKREADLGNQNTVFDQIHLLAGEEFGEGVDIFFTTPRKSLDGRSPEEAIAQGDAEDVLSGLAAISEGSDHV